MSDEQTVDDEVNKGGRPPFQPTEKQRRMVEQMYGLGLTQEQVCQFIHDGEGKLITEKTLRKHFQVELDRAKGALDRQVLGAGFRLAAGAPAEYDENDNLVRDEIKPDARMTKFWIERRVPGFERQVQLTTPEDQPIVIETNHGGLSTKEQRDLRALLRKAAES